MRRLAWLLGLVTLAVAGIYTVVSLVRWEWTRALFFGVVFVAAEVGLLAALVLARISNLQSDLEQSRGAARVAPELIDAVRRGRADHDRFPWLRREPRDVLSRTNVFVTLVVGGGLLLSAGAWLVDRLAARTVDPGREARLGRHLQAIAYREGLVVDEVEALARPRLDRDDPRLPPFLGDRR